MNLKNEPLKKDALLQAIADLGEARVDITTSARCFYDALRMRDEDHLPINFITMDVSLYNYAWFVLPAAIPMTGP